MAQPHDPRPPRDPAAADELRGPLDVDYAAALRPVLERTASDPVLRPADAAGLAARLPRTLPREGIALDAVLAEVGAVAVEHARRNAHPGFFGYVCSPGLPTDPLSHALVAALNQNVTGFASAPGATTVERTVLRWLARLAGLPDGAEGLLLSGGSLANFSALAVALHDAAGGRELERGLRGVAERFTVHLTAATHFSVARGAALLGLGREQLRHVDADALGRMRPEALDAALTDDRRSGARPCCVVGTAGATTTGAIDPLEELAEVCRRHAVWFHVDAAYGGGALLAPELRSAFRGIEHADSVTVDLHKWFYLAFDASALLLRAPERARRVFYTSADYVETAQDPRPDEFAFYLLGPETSRRFRALPAYVALRHYGAERLGRAVLHNARCADYLGALVRSRAELELVSPPQLSICCFRYAPPALAADRERVDALNAQIRDRLQPRFYMSPTRFDGRPVLRVCIQSHTTRARHVEALVRAVVETGAALTQHGTART